MKRPVKSPRCSRERRILSGGPHVQPMFVARSLPRGRSSQAISCSRLVLGHTSSERTPPPQPARGRVRERAVKFGRQSLQVHSPADGSARWLILLFALGQPSLIQRLERELAAHPQEKRIGFFLHITDVPFGREKRMARDVGGDTFPDEAIATPCDRLDVHGCPRVIVNGFPDIRDRASYRVLAHVHVGPEAIEEGLLRDDAAAAGGEAAEDLDEPRRGAPPARSRA